MVDVVDNVVNGVCIAELGENKEVGFQVGRQTVKACGAHPGIVGRPATLTLTTPHLEGGAAFSIKLAAPERAETPAAACKRRLRRKTASGTSELPR
jgi:hypothetical protein